MKKGEDMARRHWRGNGKPLDIHRQNQEERIRLRDEIDRLKKQMKELEEENERLKQILDDAVNFNVYARHTSEAVLKINNVFGLALPQWVKDAESILNTKGEADGEE